MTVPERHQRKVARDTMGLSCAGAFILGGPDHVAAAGILGRRVPEDCTCAANAATRALQEGLKSRGRPAAK